MKQVQIPESLFFDLCDYFLWEAPDYSNVEDFTQEDMEEFYYKQLNEEIGKGLQEKVDKMLDRIAFSKYKAAPTPEQREQARKEYINRKGIPRLYRSEKEVRYRNIEAQELEKHMREQMRLKKAVHDIIYENQETS
jgi:hypothetical protein